MGKTGKDFFVILAGGGGSRLWPKSRNRKPKQFLKLVSNRTMLQESFDRIADYVPVEQIFIVTTCAYLEETKNELPKIPESNILVEPQPKGTAAAVSLAAVHIEKIDPQATILVLAADHLIKKQQQFRKTLNALLKAAQKGDYLVTTGIHPTYPHTGLGYIHIEKEIFKVDGTSIFEVEAFKEKPDLTTAQAFIASGEYFWNANINNFHIKSLFNALDLHMSGLYQATVKIKDYLGSEKYNRVLEEEWEKLTNEPIDTGVLEKAKNVLVVPGDFTWSDIGDWSVLYDVLGGSTEENVLVGDRASYHLSLESAGCLIHTNGKLVATIGLEDIVIIDTADALLVCSKNRAQEVKKLVEKLKKEKREKYL